MPVVLIDPDVVVRIAEMPLVSSAYDKVSATYAETKEAHPLVKSILDAAETGIKKAATVAAIGVQPVLTHLEHQIAVVNEFACQGLNKLEEQLPILKQPVDKVILDTKEHLTLMLAIAEDAVRGAKDVVTGMAGRAKQAVQGRIEATKSVVISGVSAIMGSALGDQMANILDALLGISEDWVDHFLPITDEELAKLASSVEGLNSVTVEEQKQQRAYYAHLGSFPPKLRRRAYLHSVAKVKKVNQTIQDGLSKIHQMIDLIQYSKQAADLKCDDLQEQLNKMWLQWYTPDQGEGQEESLANPEQIESSVLVGLHNITEQLQATCCDLVSNTRGLPDKILEHVLQVQNSVVELHASFSAAASFQDISDSMVSQSKQEIRKAQESLDGLLDYLVHNVHLIWLVGPFTPAEEPAADPKTEEEINQPVNL
ncbi:perilipin-3-like [Varanus komodoensis]|uniref:perilipin-3-like n=1 Tax=Varanus komodoensis TaxID=61221 RepID=UPI001CF7CFCF|nr:perilipin-3-like [Varanus komodoensis]